MCQYVDGTTLVCRSNLTLLTSYRLKEQKKKMIKQVLRTNLLLRSRSRILISEKIHYSLVKEWTIDI